MMDEIKELNPIPKPLRTLKKPVWELYYKGDLGLLDAPKVAIIGSRRMSSYTKLCVLNLASTLKNAGVVVVSGGAIGVDIYAARGAMPATIGVFANSLDRIYPRTNESSIKEIYEKGLALSEKRTNHAPKPYDFLQRNRIIIALSQAVVIAQADIKSGSMYSAKLAKEMKKPIFTLPQRLGESNGTNSLLSCKDALAIYDFEMFAASFGGEVQKINDPLLKAIHDGQNSLESLLASYGGRIYELELEGKIQILGTKVRLI